MYYKQKMILKMMILISFLQYITANEEANTKVSNSHCNTSLKLCSGYLKAETLTSLPLTTNLPPNLNSGRDIYERSWTTILPIFFLILFGTLCIHCCHRCYTRGSREPSTQAIIPSAPTAPTSPLLSPPLVVTFASIHSNPFEQHMTPHTASLLVRPSIRDADPRARPPIGPLLQFRGLPYDGNPAPSAPSAELVVTPQAYRPPMNPGPDLPPPYHLALQLEEPPPPYSEIRVH